jgi:hypothetical protein
VGSWKANPEKSRPKTDKANTYVCTIARDGDDRVISSRMHLRRRFSGDKVFENHNRIRCDGLPHRVQCGDLFCIESCIYKGTNVIQGQTLGADRTMSYWMRVVSVDAQETIVLEYTDKSRTHVTSTSVLDRVK